MKYFIDVQILKFKKQVNTANVHFLWAAWELSGIPSDTVKFSLENQESKVSYTVFVLKHNSAPYIQYVFWWVLSAYCKLEVIYLLTAYYCKLMYLRAV